MTFEHSFLVPDTHPSIKDHFPGSPVVPGVVILGEILCLIREHRSSPCVGSPTIKFHSPLRPNEMVLVRMENTKSDEVSFQGSVGKRTIVSGVFHFQEDSPYFSTKAQHE